MNISAKKHIRRKIIKIHFIVMIKIQIIIIVTAIFFISSLIYMHLTQYSWVVFSSRPSISDWLHHHSLVHPLPYYIHHHQHTYIHTASTVSVLATKVFVYLMINLWLIVRYVCSRYIYIFTYFSSNKMPFLPTYLLTYPGTKRSFSLLYYHRPPTQGMYVGMYAGMVCTPIVFPPHLSIISYIHR